VTPADLRRLLVELGIGSAQLAVLCGVDRITVWRWRQGKIPVPVYAETILALMQHVNALEAHYRVPEASRLSAGLRRARNGHRASGEAGADGS
jgi:transcriptional regulator with XRE-family HTH domain